MALIGFFISSKIVISYGNSVDHKIFWKIVPEGLENGHYVMVTTDKNDCFAKGMNISKKIGCSSGETLIIHNDDYYCKGEYLGKAKKYSKTGIPVKAYNPCGATEKCEYRIPEGFYFVVGTHKDSYDSKYFGVVPKEKILARLLPIW